MTEIGIGAIEQMLRAANAAMDAQSAVIIGLRAELATARTDGARQMREACIDAVKALGTTTGDLRGVGIQRAVDAIDALPLPDGSP